MKRSKRLGILLGILVVACAATIGVMKLEEYQEQIRTSDEIILEIDSDTVDSLSWENGSETLSFHKDEKWVYDGDEMFPVDAGKVDELLEQFEAFGVSFVIESVEDYGQYGLDDPVCTIRLTAGDTSWEMQLGDFSAMDSQRYVSIGDGNVYLAANDPLEQFDAALSDMIDNDEAPELDNVTAMSFEGQDSYDVIYEEDSTRSYCADDVYFVPQGEDYLPLDTTLVENYLNSVHALELTDYVTYNATSEELEAYGMDAPELTLTVDYQYEDENEELVPDTFVIHVSRDPEERAAAEEAAQSAGDDAQKDPEESAEDEEEEVTAYARVGESPIIYQITSYEYKKLMAAARDDLRHKEVLTADFADITQVDITLEGSQYTLTAHGESGTEDEDRTWSYGEEEVDISDFKSALNGLKADSFTDSQPSGQEEIRLVIHLDNENHPQGEIALYRYDGADCLAVVNGEPVSLVARSLVVDLIESVHAIILG